MRDLNNICLRVFLQNMTELIWVFVTHDEYIFNIAIKKPDSLFLEYAFLTQVSDTFIPFIMATCTKMNDTTYTTSNGNIVDVVIFGKNKCSNLTYEPLFKNRKFVRFLKKDSIIHVYVTYDIESNTFIEDVFGIPYYNLENMYTTLSGYNYISKKVYISIEYKDTETNLWHPINTLLGICKYVSEKTEFYKSLFFDQQILKVITKISKKSLYYTYHRECNRFTSNNGRVYIDLSQIVKDCEYYIDSLKILHTVLYRNSINVWRPIIYLKSDIIDPTPDIEEHIEVTHIEPLRQKRKTNYKTIFEDGQRIKLHNNSTRKISYYRYNTSSDTFVSEKDGKIYNYLSHVADREGYKKVGSVWEIVKYEHKPRKWKSINDLKRKREDD